MPMVGLTLFNIQLIDSSVLMTKATQMLLTSIKDAFSQPQLIPSPVWYLITIYKFAVNASMATLYLLEFVLKITALPDNINIMELVMHYLPIASLTLHYWDAQSVSIPLTKLSTKLALESP
jgi:hypothetical protein